MQVYLVQPPIGGTPEDVTPPLGLLLLAAQLEADGHEVRVVDLNLQSKQGRLDASRSLRTQFVKALPKRSSQIDLIGVTTWSYGFEAAMEFVEAIKRKHPTVPVVLGGPHVSFVDRPVMERFDAVDLILRDEADRTLPQLVRALALDEPAGKLAMIQGLTWRRGGEVVQNPRGGVVEDLDGLPYPAFHLVDVREYVAAQPTLVLEAGRGCPYNCNFCSTTNMFQRKYRAKSAARLVDEVEWMMGVSGTKRFELLHDNLVANKKYVLSLCREIRARNIDVEWSCTSRTDNLTEEVAQEMFLAGCEQIFFGIESLSEERQRWTGKRLKPPKVHAAVELTARQHVRPSLGIIVGFPDETAEELDATVGAAVRWAADARIGAEVSTAMLRYYPGADLFAHKDELRYDPLAAADSNAIPGYELRPEWRELTELFPLASIQMTPEETRRNLTRRNLVRVLLKACPNALRAMIDVAGLGPGELLDRMAAGRRFEFLERRDKLTLWNETLRAFAAVARDVGDEVALEALACEVPFWETEPVIDAIDHLEHVIHPKRFEQGSLLDRIQGRRAERPEAVEGVSILAIRCGFENVVWFTDRPRDVLETFQRHFEKEPQATIAFVNSLRRGL